MTKPTAGGTKHNWLIDDMAAVLADFKSTADHILKNLKRFQETGEQACLTNAALRSAELFQEIARATTLLAEMRQLVESSKPARTETPEWVRGELNDLRSLLQQLMKEADND